MKLLHYEHLVTWHQISVPRSSTCAVIDIPMFVCKQLLYSAVILKQYHSHEYTFRVVEVPTSLIPLHSHRVESREVLLTPLQATDQGETITMVTTSDGSFTQINTEDIALQETNPATPGQLVFGHWSIAQKYYKVFVLWHNCYTSHMHIIIILLLSNLV